MTGSPISCSNLRNRRNPSNSNYHMSINNCQAIEKSCIDRKLNAWLREQHLFFKLLDNRQSEVRESSELIMYKLSCNTSTEKFQAIQKKKFSSISKRICRIATQVVTSYLFPVKRDAYSWREIFSTSEVSFDLWFHAVTIDSRFVLNCTL